MALSLSGEGITYLQPGQWQTTIAYRRLTGDEGFIGDRVDPTYASTIGAQLAIHSLDLQATYAFSSRSSLSLTLPVVRGAVSSFRDHENDGIHRHTMRAAGLGDARLTWNRWLLDPSRNPAGNVSLSAGVKMPTGESRALDTAFRPDGAVEVPVDIAIQPGDGGWGVIVEGVAFRRLAARLHGYGAGFYLFSPRETNSAVTTVPVYGRHRNLSVPDQYFARAGVNYALAPGKGVSVSLGGRVDGVPARDAVGGSDGFRRPGFSIYAEPGLAVARQSLTFSLSTPVAVYRNRQKNVYDHEFGGHGPGAFARFLVVASVSRRF